MGLLETVNQMKKQGRTDSEIITELQEQGVAPKNIQDALSQSQIKQAISQEEEVTNFPPTPEEEEYSPSPQLMPITQEQAFPEQNYNGNYENQNYAPQQYADANYGYNPGTGLDTDTIIEVSEQVFSEKVKEIQKQIDAMSEFSSLATTKIQNMQERLKRIETTIDKLQLSILDKVGSYGQNLESIKNEMSMIESSFSKLASSKKR